MRLTGHLAAETKRHFSPKSSPHPDAKQTKTRRLRATRRTCETYWKTKQDRQDRSTDHGGAPQRVTTTVMPDILKANPAGPNTADQTHMNCVVMLPHTEAPHPLCFTDEVMEHQFPEGFKPVNIESYDGTIDPVRPDQSMDQGGVPQREMTAIKLGAIGITSHGLKTDLRYHPNFVVTLPDTEVPHTPYALPMR